MAHHQKHAEQVSEPTVNLWCVPCEEPAEISNAIQPVRYPDPHLLRMIPSVHDNIVINSIPSVSNCPTVTIPSTVSQVTGQCARVDTRRDLADTGVSSVSATGRLDILHHFTPHTPYEIMGYDGTVTRAAGQGIAYVKSPDHDRLEEMSFVYIPSVDGTIISLEHHTRTHHNIHKWTQEAIPTTDMGWVTFRDKNDEVVSRYQTKQEKGQYYIQDLEFYPTQPEKISTCQQTVDEDSL